MFKVLIGAAAGYWVGMRVAEMRAANVQEAVQLGLEQWMSQAQHALESEWAQEQPVVPPPPVVMASQGPYAGSRAGFGRLVPGHAPTH